MLNALKKGELERLTREELQSHRHCLHPEGSVRHWQRNRIRSCFGQKNQSYREGERWKFIYSETLQMYVLAMRFIIWGKNKLEKG